MKRFALALLICLPAFGAGSVGQSINPLGPPVSPSGLPDNRTYVMAITWIGDSVTGTVPSTVISIAAVPQVQGMRLIQIEITPGSPSPTAGYSVTLTDGSSVDLLQGQGANLSATNSLYTGALLSPPLLTSPTFALSGNSVASARGTVILYFAPLSTAAAARGLPATLPANNAFTGTQTFSAAVTHNAALIVTPSLTTPQAAGNVVSETCLTSQRTETGADANLLTCAIPAVAGSYRLRCILSISAANAATLGWTATWTDSNGTAEAPTNIPMVVAGTNGSQVSGLTVTTSTGSLVLSGDFDVDVNNSATSIVVKLTFSGTSFTGKASATVERLV